MAACFALFALRSFCWLLYIDGEQLKIQSPHNLGDLALHITYIKYFANGVALWPDNPIHVFSSLRYPAGIDLFDSLLLLQHVDLVRALVWTGLLGSLATFYGFYRWGGAFGVAGFLFNGGLAGYAFFQKFRFADYQAEKIAWMITDRFQAKSILAWVPGWVQSDPSFAAPAFQFGFVKVPSALGFWIYDFGLTLPAMIALVGVVVWQMWGTVAEGKSRKSRLL